MSNVLCSPAGGVYPHTGRGQRGLDEQVVAAVEDTLALADIARSVVLIHRRHEFLASVCVLDTLHKSPVKVWTPSVVTEVLSDDTGVTAVRVKDFYTGDLEADGLFVAIGHDPTSRLFAHGSRSTSGGTW